MEFGVLGPLRVWCGGAEISLPAGKHRALLAALLLRANQMVSVSDLIVQIWDDEPPGSARATTQTYVGRLRRALGEGLIVTRPDGYQIIISDDQLDLTRFDRLVARAAAGDPAEAVALLDRALGLWRGPALADVPSDALHRNEVPALAERRLGALERRIDLDLAAGRGADLVTQLRTLTAEHPLRERFWAQLMAALAGGGRRGEALRAYQEVRTLLTEELGVDPGSELRQLHLAILRGDVPPAASVQAEAPVGGGPAPHPPPAQLPPDVAGFTGRAHPLRQLDDLLADRADRAAAATAIAVVEGMAGIGKTALAVHWGHRVRDRFVDGQLYVDLRGYGPGLPVRPIDALASFLLALGVAPERTPSDVDAATALYRSLVADRRLLVLLDNAAGPDQVRPLLPGGTGCLVLVTSRDRLGGLVARDGARPLPLEVLTPQEADVLLGATLGAARVRAEPDATAELAALCGRLPLALRIAAANLTAYPGLTLAAYNTQLRDRDRLAALAVSGDDQAAVAAAFGLSYDRLSPAGRRIFRLLGLAPGPDIALDAAAALADIAGLPVERAESVLAALAGAHLVDQPAPGRYTLHDLLRCYAAERAVQDESAQERDAARHRLYHHYLRRADAAARVLYPQVLRLPAPDVDGDPGFVGPDQALAWLDAEWTNLAATVTATAASGPRAVAWRLADCLRGYLWLRRRTVGWPALASDALAAARAEGELHAQAVARLSLGDLELLVGRYRPATEHYTATLALAGEAGWPDGQAAALGQLGVAYRSLGQPQRAADHHTRALTLNRETGRRGGEAVCLGNLGVVCEELGQLARAAEHTGQALELFRQLGSQAAEANALGNLGHLERLLGRLDDAEAHLTDALARHREAGQPAGEATALDDLAALHRDRGQAARARELAVAAVALTDEISDRFYQAAALNTLASVHLDLDQPELAVEHHRRALELARQTSDRTHETTALVGMAAAQRLTGRLDEALASATEALAIAAHAAHLTGEGDAHTALAQIHLDQTEHARAASHAGRALEIHIRTGYRLGEARTYLVLGDLAERTGDTDAAAAHWCHARTVFADLGIPGTGRRLRLVGPGRAPAGWR